MISNLELATFHYRVVLHDALKSKELVGLCEIGEGWFGVISAWSQKTETEKVAKQSNLCLSIIGTVQAPFVVVLGQMFRNGVF